MTDNNDRDVARGPLPEVKSRPNIALIGFLVVVVLAVVFFLENGENVNIDFFVYEKTTTLRWSIIVAVVLGILIDRVFSIWWRRRRRRDRD